MTEKAYFFTTGTSGDGTSTYTQSDLSTAMEVVAVSNGFEGVAPGYLNSFAASIPGANAVRIASGGAMVDGKPYQSDGNVDVTIASAVGGGNTRIDRIVLRANWAAHTVRITRIAGTDAGSPTAPAITQTPGTTYDIELFQVTVNTSGVVTVTTDERVFAYPGASSVPTAALQDNSATNAKLRDSAAVSVIGRSANTSGDPADIAAGANDTFLQRVSNALNWAGLTIGMVADNLITFAKLAQLAGLSVLGRSANTTGNMAAITGTDGQVLRVSGTTLGFGTLVAAAYAALSVGTAAMALNSVDDTIAGNRVPQFYRRQGGSATNWATTGTTTQTPTAVRMQAGSTAFDLAGSLTITFPVAFSNVPLVYALSSGSLPVRLFSTTATQVVMTGSASEVVNWFAVGPE